MVNEFVYLLEFIVIAFMGGITRALIQARKPQDLTRFDVLKTILLSPIAGFLYAQMVFEWNAPDHVVVFFFAYSFVDIVDRLAKMIISLGKRSMS